MTHLGVATGSTSGSTLPASPPVCSTCAARLNDQTKTLLPDPSLLSTAFGGAANLEENGYAPTDSVLINTHHQTTLEPGDESDDEPAPWLAGLELGLTFVVVVSLWGSIDVCAELLSFDIKPLEIVAYFVFVFTSLTVLYVCNRCLRAKMSLGNALSRI